MWPPLTGESSMQYLTRVCRAANLSCVFASPFGRDTMFVRHPTFFPNFSSPLEHELATVKGSHTSSKQSWWGSISRDGVVILCRSGVRRTGWKAQRSFCGKEWIRRGVRDRVSNTPVWSTTVVCTDMTLAGDWCSLDQIPTTANSETFLQRRQEPLALRAVAAAQLYTTSREVHPPCLTFNLKITFHLLTPPSRIILPLNIRFHHQIFVPASCCEEGYWPFRRLEPFPLPAVALTSHSSLLGFCSISNNAIDQFACLLLVSQHVNSSNLRN